MPQRFAERPALVARQRVDLGQRVGESVRDLHVAPAQLPHQLHVMVAGTHRAESCRTMLCTIRTVSRMRGRDRRGLQQRSPCVLPDATRRRRRGASDRQESAASGRSQAAPAILQLVRASMHVADNVERPVLVGRSFHSGTGSMTAASTSSTLSNTKTCRNPSAAGSPAIAASAPAAVRRHAARTTDRPARGSAHGRPIPAG